MKRAMITGITGQDGSYLVELLLDKGYEVIGAVRRSSTEPFERIEHIRHLIKLEQVDLLDQASIMDAIQKHRPHEIYNLGAMSFVPTSWAQPIYTAESTGLGVTRILEAIRRIDSKIRFYQASSSEMFGKVHETPQSETTPFHPRSPYGVAKVYGHYITMNYRESYGIHASSGILFNHESVTSDTPIIVKQRGLIDICQINEIVRFQKDKHKVQKDLSNEGISVWDGNCFANVLTGSAYKHAKIKDNKHIKRVTAGHGSFTTTSNHVTFLSTGDEVKTKDLKVGDKLFEGHLPKSTLQTLTTIEEAKLMGMFVGDGSATIMENGGISGKFINNDVDLLKLFEQLWQRVCGGYVSFRTTTGGFGNSVKHISLLGVSTYLKTLKSICYTKDNYKRIPKIILNSAPNIMEAFLEGYNLTDGLKESKCTYKFQRFGSNSQTLVMGLWYLIQNTTHQVGRLTYEHKNSGYFKLNLQTTSNTQKGVHLKRPTNEIIRIDSIEDYDGWLYDLETTTGTFTAGIGNIKIHNSPRRGLEFVTRKVTDGAARIKLQLQNELRLGNLDAKRDWGHARDFVRAMWLMLQQDVPDDYVISTGQTYSIAEMCDIAFSHLGMNYKDHVVTDPAFIRPAEVDLLLGNSAKAYDKLNWKPEISFEDMIMEMVDVDLERLKNLKSMPSDVKNPK